MVRHDLQFDRIKPQKMTNNYWAMSVDGGGKGKGRASEKKGPFLPAVIGRLKSGNC